MFSLLLLNDHIIYACAHFYGKVHIFLVDDFRVLPCRIILFLLRLFFQILHFTNVPKCIMITFADEKRQKIVTFSLACLTKRLNYVKIKFPRMDS